MQLPVDVKALIEEATNIDEARETPLSVSVYVDESAPGDVVACVRTSFASTCATARVSLTYLDGRPFVPYEGDDIAVVVAGFSDGVGSYARQLREVGVPVMVVTSMPRLVGDIADMQGFSIPCGDVVSPSLGFDKCWNLKKEQEGASDILAEQEPIVLNGRAEAALKQRMGQWIITTCHEKRLAFALAFHFVRRPLSSDAVNATAAQNAGIGLVVFLPGADLPIMTLNQAKMLLQIAASYGQPMTINRVKELAAVVGGAFAFRSVARQVVAFVPFFGWAVKAIIGYTGTQAMGRAAIEYFENGGNIAGLAGVVGRAREKVLEVAVDVHAAASDNKGRSVHRQASVVSDGVQTVAQRAKQAAVPFASSVARAGAQAIGVDAPSVAKAALRSLAKAKQPSLKDVKPKQ